MSKTAYSEDDVRDPPQDVLVLYQQVFSLLSSINKYDCAPVALLDWSETGHGLNACPVLSFYNKSINTMEIYL